MRDATPTSRLSCARMVMRSAGGGGPGSSLPSRPGENNLHRRKRAALAEQDFGGVSSITADQPVRNVHYAKDPVIDNN